MATYIGHRYKIDAKNQQKKQDVQPANLISYLVFIDPLSVVKEEVAAQKNHNFIYNFLSLNKFVSKWLDGQQDDKYKHCKAIAQVSLDQALLRQENKYSHHTISPQEENCVVLNREGIVCFFTLK